ncbi:hypothetical protein MASR2M54_04970 [Aliarcobacter cryaerophilus]
MRTFNKTFEKYCLNVIGVKYGTQEYLEEWIELMGKTTANHIKANEILKWHKDIKEKLSKLSSSKTTKPKILSLQFSKDRFRVAGNGSYDNFIIELIVQKIQLKMIFKDLQIFQKNNF